MNAKDLRIVKNLFGHIPDLFLLPTPGTSESTDASKIIGYRTGTYEEEVYDEETQTTNTETIPYIKIYFDVELESATVKIYKRYINGDDFVGEYPIVDHMSMITGDDAMEICNGDRLGEHYDIHPNLPDTSEIRCEILSNGIKKYSTGYYLINPKATNVSQGLGGAYVLNTIEKNKNEVAVIYVCQSIIRKVVSFSHIRTECRNVAIDGYPSKGTQAYYRISILTPNPYLEFSGDESINRDTLITELEMTFGEWLDQNHDYIYGK